MQLGTGVFSRRNIEAMGGGGNAVQISTPPYWRDGRLQGLLNTDSLPLNQVDGMPIAQYLEHVRPNLLASRGYRHYDTRVIIAGQNITADTYNFFAVNKGGNETSIDGSITILGKTEEYTNAIENGKIEGGNSMLVESLQFECFMPHRDWNAFTTAKGLPSTGAPSATDTNSATNTLSALILGTSIKFGEYDKPPIGTGQIDDFPDPGGIDGAFGGSTPEGFARVVRGKAWLDQVLLLQPLHNFYLTMQVFRTITIPISAIIRASLVGVKLYG